MTPATQRSVLLFCGSRPGTNPALAEAATAFGTALAAANLRLVYGAGDVGLMGAAAAAAQDAGGDTFGVIPEHLERREVGRRGINTYVVTETMHERKKVMFMNAGAIACLPGGPGSLDELFEVLTWRQLGLHSRPVFLLNVDGYWDPLLALLDHIIAQGFADASFRDYLDVCDTVPELMDGLRDALA